jgi:hypothetical protein
MQGSAHDCNVPLITSSQPVSLKKKVEAIPVMVCGGPWGCEMSRLLHFLDSRLTDGDNVDSLTRWPHFTPQEEIPGTHFC